MSLTAPALLLVEADVLSVISAVVWCASVGCIFEYVAVAAAVFAGADSEDVGATCEFAWFLDGGFVEN